MRYRGKVKGFYSHEPALKAAVYDSRSNIVRRLSRPPLGGGGAQGFIAVEGLVVLTCDGCFIRLSEPIV